MPVSRGAKGHEAFGHDIINVHWTWLDLAMETVPTLTRTNQWVYICVAVFELIRLE